MKIGIIDNHDSFVYNLVRYVRECDGTETTVMRNDSVCYGTLDKCDALLLSPGPGIPEEAGELIPVIQRYAGSKPLLGICLGHQAIAQVFGGQLHPCTVPVHGRSSEIRLHGNDLLFDRIPPVFYAGRYHSWQVLLSEKGPLETIADTDEGIVMAFRHTGLPIHGLQFHPESILTPHGRQIIHNWIKNSV